MTIPQADELEIQNRFDLTIMRAYAQTDNVATTRSRIIKLWQSDETLSQLALSRQAGVSGLSAEDDQRAVTNLADYWFEPYALPTMSIGQARDYYLAIQDVLRFVISPADRPVKRPIVLETLHHCCAFSILFVSVQELIRKFALKRFILLHLRDELDPRLEICRNLLDNVLHVEAFPISIRENWLDVLQRSVTEDTLIVYMGDMPASMFPKLRTRKNTDSILRLYAEPGIEIMTERVSIAGALTRRLNADHYTLDFPEKDTAHLQSWTHGALSCPLPDWVFWPALERWYNRIPAPAGTADTRQ